MPFSRNFYAATCLAFFASLAFAADSTKLAGIDLQGKSLDLRLTGSEKLAVLIFVRTDCPISNRYAPTIQKLAAEHAGQAHFWLVYPDQSESTTIIERHLHDYNYTNIAAIRDPQHTLVHSAQAKITPEAAVFDRNFRLIYHGRIDNWYQSFGHARPAPTTNDLEEVISAVLVGKPAPIAETKAVGCYISDAQ